MSLLSPKQFLHYLCPLFLLSVLNPDVRITGSSKIRSHEIPGFNKHQFNQAFTRIRLRLKDKTSRKRREKKE